MPNWCSNILTIRGPVLHVSLLRGYLRCLNPNDESDLSQRVLDYERIAPQPPELPTGNILEDDTYYWRIEHWGVKWNYPTLWRDEQTDYRKGTARLIWGFDTPWSPPIPFVTTLAERFPTLTYRLHYREDGNGVLGVYLPERDSDETLQYAILARTLQEMGRRWHSPGVEVRTAAGDAAAAVQAAIQDATDEESADVRS